MELTAAIKALEALKRPCAVDLYTDSQYVRHGITSGSGWKTRRLEDRRPEAGEERGLWRALDAARSATRSTWHWVRGHADDPLNHRVDALAVAAMAPFRKRARREAGLNAANRETPLPNGDLCEHLSRRERSSPRSGPGEGSARGTDGAGRLRRQRRNPLP